ncbi:MAG: MBL fold metallo-hydrolase [PVC group bacterium]
MKIKRLVVGTLQANCYILADDDGQAAIIDPGGDPDVIVSVIERENLTPVVLINTHGHIDHIAANRALKEQYGVPLLIHHADAGALADPDRNLSLLGLGRIDSPACDRELQDDDEVEVGRLKLKVVSTPGHSPGSVCLRLPRGDEPDLVFTGDTLFAGGVGRTDFPGGSMNQLMASIKNRLLSFPDDTMILPGHGPHSTIGEERNSNPFIIFPGEK